MRLGGPEPAEVLRSVPSHNQGGRPWCSIHESQTTLHIKHTQSSRECIGSQAV